jgi:hypothetical protein
MSSVVSVSGCVLCGLRVPREGWDGIPVLNDVYGYKLVERSVRTAGCVGRSEVFAGIDEISSLYCASNPGPQPVAQLLYRLRHPSKGRGSSVGIATRCGLNSPRTKSRLRRDFPRLSRPTLGPTQPLIIGYRVFHGGKAAGTWR